MQKLTKNNDNHQQKMIFNSLIKPGTKIFVATKIDKIFTVYLTLCSKCQIDGEEFVDFCGLLGKCDYGVILALD